MKSLYVIDHSNFCYKFSSIYTFCKREKNGVAIDYSILFGYLRALKANLAQDICIVLDGTPKTSKSILPGYKGQRLKNEDVHCSVSRKEVVQFLTKIGYLLNKNIFVVCAPNQEADQVISSITHIITKNLPPRASLIDKINTSAINEDKCLSFLGDVVTTKDISWNDYDTVIIATTDSDMKALQRYNNVYIDTSVSGKTIESKSTADAVCNANSYVISLYKGIFGDVSDNVPALPLKLDKTKVLKVLNDSIQSNSDLEEFIMAVQSEDKTYKLHALTKLLYKDGVKKKFLNNLWVTKLDYYSNPIKLSYPNYNIIDTIEKYGLKI